MADRRDRFDPAESGYIEVAERVELFYKSYPEGRIASSPPVVVMIEGDTGKHLEHAQEGEGWVLVDGPDTEGNTFVRRQTFVEVSTTVWRGPDDPHPCSASAWEVYPGRTPYTRESEMMNAETSAVGRALWAVGIEARRGAASKEDVEKSRAAANDAPQSGPRKLPDTAPRPAMAAQVKSAQILYSKLGVPEADRKEATRQYLELDALDSHKSLDTRQAARLIDHLERRVKALPAEEAS